MSIGTSLFTGASGLDAHGDAISVVGDNIANASTTGFKAERAEFSSIVGGLAPDGQRLGNGVEMSGVQLQFGQGSIQSTGGTYDMAIRGGGFFIVKGNFQGVPGDYYTRDGRFQLDKDGFLVNPEGLKLQGYLINSQGQTATSVSDLKIGGENPPDPTTETTLSTNLNSTDAISTFNIAKPADSTSSSFATSTTVYDSLGASHRVDVYFSRTGTNQWNWHAVVDSSDLGLAAGTPTDITNPPTGGTLTFDNTGKLVSQTGNAVASFANAAPNQPIAFNFGDPTSAGGTGLAGTTQFASPSNVKAITQDGYAAGGLVDVLISEDGTITGKFNNGTSRPICRLAMASFASETGLKRTANQLFQSSTESGAALVAAANTGDRGAIASGSLEASNVDLGNELVTLIAYQRAFTANSRTVNTADQMLQEVSNLGR